MKLTIKALCSKAALSITLLALVSAASAPESRSQGFGYSSASPHQATVRLNVKAKLTYAAGSTRHYQYFASTSRDMAGIAAGSTVLFEFEEGMMSRLNNYFNTADVTGICTDYNTASSTCQNGWKTASTSATSKVATFPSLPYGADVVQKTMAFRVAPRVYNTLGQYLGYDPAGVATVAYFLTPPADAFYRDAAGNEIAVWRQRAVAVGSQLFRPLLIAEGIDLNDRSEPDGYFGQLGPLANGLRDGGYDVAVISFGDPLQSVRQHESGFRSAVQLVHSLKQSAQESTAVIGLSRGGVVARYALAKMEELGIPHHTSLFISYDSPQRGANINYDLQEEVFNRLQEDPDGQILIGQLESPGVRELLIESPKNEPPNTDLHTAFYDEIEALNGGFGYAQNLRRVAWSNGIWSPPTFTGNLFLEIDIDISGEDVEIPLTDQDRAPGSFLPPVFSDLVVGRTNNADLTFFQRVGFVLGHLLYVPPLNFLGADVNTFYTIIGYNDPTFIPTASALDRDGPTASTPFNRAEHSTIRRSHAALPDEAVTMILDELGLLPPLSASINGPTLVPGWQTATWTAVVINGSGPITYRWDYQNNSCSGGPLDPLTGEGNPSGESEQADGFDGGVVTPESIPCDEWHFGGSASSYSRQMNDARATLRLTVTRGSETAVAYKYLTRDDSGGNLAQTGNNAEHRVTGASQGGSAAASASATSLPEAFALYAAIPNPVSSTATIRYDLPEASEVSLVVYDLLGREAARLASGSYEAGVHSVPFNSANLPSGVYLVRLQAGSFVATERFTIVK